jgi:hypothetical protein
MFHWIRTLIRGQPSAPQNRIKFKWELEYEKELEESEEELASCQDPKRR